MTMSENLRIKPRLLLVEDDSISSQFMSAALQAIPAQVDSAASVRDALAYEGSYDLWLLDANLPDGSGSDLLRQLRSRFPSTPAMAHTADDSPALRARLLADGFDTVLVKPLTAMELQRAARRLLGPASDEKFRAEDRCDDTTLPPLWEHAVALAALNGNRQHVETLRRMFLQELAGQHREIRHAIQSGDLQAARKVLHQLKASSGFVGAMRLNKAADLLEKSLSAAGILADFSAVVLDTQSSGEIDLP